MEIINTAQHVERSAQLFPDRHAIFFGDTVLSYAQLNAECNRGANSFIGFGICRGDRVVLWLPNSTAFVIAYLALQKLGAIAVTVDSALKPREIAFILEDSGAKLLLTTTALYTTLDHETVSIVDQVILIDSTQGDVPCFEELLRQTSAEYSTAVTTECDPAALLYTSGTTGFPKGALLSQGSIVFSARTAVATLRLVPQDRVLLCLPMSHSFAQTGGLNPCFEAGATLLLHRQWEVGAVLRALQEEAATVFCGVPMIYRVLYEQATREQLQSVRLFLSGGAPVTDSIIRAWFEKYQTTIHECYGLTETCMASFNHDPLRKPGSIGRPLPGTEFRLLHESGDPVAPGEIGEIAIHTKSAMLGYWNRQAETEAVFREGWFRTGDIGRKDTEGYYHLVDRSKDMVNVGGLKVYPSEVEHVLCQHPAVCEAAVYGTHEILLGEQVRASVVLQPNQKIDAKALIDFCNQRLAPFKVPSTVDFVDQIPKSRSGKILRRLLRDRWQSMPPLPSTGTTPLRRQWHETVLDARKDFLQNHVRTLVLDLLGVTPEEHTPFSSLPMDSLQSIQLSSRLSATLGMTLPPTMAFTYNTLAKITAFLGARLDTDDADPSHPTQTAHQKTIAVNEWYPQLYNQRECFVWYETVPNKAFLHVHLSVYVRSRIDVPCLEQALRTLVERHEILRTVYTQRGTECLQRTLPTQTLDFVVVNIALQEENQPWSWEAEAILRAVQQPFDLETGPIMRVRLWSRGVEDHLLLFVHHHIAMDATASGVFLHELWEIYRALRTDRRSLLPPVSTSWRDFVQWHLGLLQNAEGERLWQFWKERMGEPPQWKMQTDYPRPQRDSHRGWQCPFETNATLTQQLRQLARREESTLYGVLMTAFAIFLHGYTHEEDVVVATHVANRNDVSFASVVGYVSDTMPIRMTMVRRATFQTMLHSVHASLLAALDHQGFPLRLLAERLHLSEEPSQTVLCHAWFTLLPLRIFQESSALFRADPMPVQLGGLTIEVADLIPIHHGAWYDLDMVLTEGENTVFGMFVCKKELFSEGTLLNMVSQFETLLRIIVDNPMISVERLVDVLSFTPKIH